MLRSLKAAVPVAIKQPIKDLLRDWRRGDVLEALDRAATQRFPMSIPSVDEWFGLSLKYREFHRPSHAVLKDYGYMAIMAYLDARPELRRILEFGHGFNSTIFRRYNSDREVWGLDDFQDLPYFTARDRREWEAEFDREVRAQAPGCTFRRGLLGSDGNIDLPRSYFDAICSVSVLEEIPVKTLSVVLQHAARLLRPGGVLIGTHDLIADQPPRIFQYAKAHAAAGLELETTHRPGLRANSMLLESPTAAMLYYQEDQGDTRIFLGHWTTIWSVARKPV